MLMTVILRKIGWAVFACVFIACPEAYAFRANFAFWLSSAGSCQFVNPWNTTGINWITSNAHTYSNPTWTTYSNALPGNVSSAKAAVIGEYVYLFGGHNGSSNGQLNSIHRAPVSNPTSWSNTGKTLPANLYSAQLAVIGKYLYLFGGSSGSYVNTIYRAPLSDPTSWTNAGSTLPANIGNSQVAIIGDYVYLIGGNSSRNVYRAPLTTGCE